VTLKATLIPIFFSEEIFQEWEWSERYPGHAEIRNYLNYVSNKYSLNKDIQLNTQVISATYDEKKLKEYMQWGSIEIEINLKLGNDAFKCYTCDFTHDYIDINADYRN